MDCLFGKRERQKEEEGERERGRRRVREGGALFFGLRFEKHIRGSRSTLRVPVCPEGEALSGPVVGGRKEGNRGRTPQRQRIADSRKDRGSRTT